MLYLTAFYLLSLYYTYSMLIRQSYANADLASYQINNKLKKLGSYLALLVVMILLNDRSSMAGSIQLLDP